MRSFCRKTCVHKIPRFRGFLGGNWGFFGGGSANFIFMGAGIFLIESLGQLSQFSPDLSQFSQVWSVLVKLSQLQAGHTRQKRTIFLPTGRWGKQQQRSRRRSAI